MKNITEFLKKCRVNGNEKIDTNDDSFWKLKDLLEHYKEQCNTPVVSNSAYLCKNVNGEDAVIIAENIASVFDKLEDITPAPEHVEVSGKSITIYK